MLRSAPASNELSDSEPGELIFRNIVITLDDGRKKRRSSLPSPSRSAARTIVAFVSSLND